eukprot:TRINITY_DN260_c0_g1_i6.p1 TRINITY_DN260_c0_g1~~TRINITY_DN260_c0_g1_i6.p1  ORF type:complete len:280 (-),score=48.06 TRINITY_DN260_c0_g1_i6:1032-1811(-)
MSTPIDSSGCQRVEIVSLIARGGNSAVHFGRNLDTFEPLAIKEIVLDQNGRAVFSIERRLLGLLPPHKNVPPLLGHMKTQRKGYLILPFLPFPNIQSFLSDRGALPEEDALYILAQMVEAVSFITRNGVAHRDIKAENIIINPDTLLIKLIDFGLGMKVDDEYTSSTQFIGTPIYMSPETLKRGSAFWVCVADLWSVGVVFLELLQGDHPFKGAKSEKHLLEMHRNLDISSYSRRSRALLRLLLNEAPEERVEALDLVR